MSGASTDQKNGMILAVGWASLAVYVIYCFELSELMLAERAANESLVWTRARANILLGINDSVPPCDDFYGHSCGVLLKGQSGAFFNAQLGANWFVENTPAYKACADNPAALLPAAEMESADDGSGELSSGRVFAAFASGCTLANLSVAVRPVNRTYRLVVDTVEGSPDLAMGGLPCLAALGLDGELAALEKHLAVGTNACDAIDVKAPPRCRRLATCRDYVAEFFPESLNGYGSICPERASALVTRINAAMGANRTVHFGGGQHAVRDAPVDWMGENASDLRWERGGRIFNLLGAKVGGAWEMPATAVNAYYTPDTDEVYIAGGLLVEPFYHHDYPDTHNLAGIGFIIAHEIGHSFGPRAAKQYGRPDTAGTVAALAANLTLRSGHPGDLYGSELFADWKAAEALSALVDRPTPLFFHHMAQAWCQRHQEWYSDDPHPPHRWRVNMTATAFPSFAPAFGCTR